MIGKREPAVRADPVVPRQLHGNPPLHTLALDKDDFLLEREARGLLKTSASFSLRISRRLLV